ncbi:cation:proton antiporter [Haloprofundus salilacus]|uniref:cation:proton antiporter n=1 Tax=Haloprofundus salilacus TaxID=2876190 RepID=UPI001CCC6B09|nr:cation:proton antiporter [Haloprofundus salilacus]
MSAYDVTLIIVALALLGAVALPRLLEHRPLSFPMIYVGLGVALFSFPGVPTVDPIGNAVVTERLTELVVIVSLMGAGLKLDRPFDWRSWSSTWRLLGIALPLTIAAVALLAWGVLGLLPATAILLGAVIAPTDPVLASDIGAGAPLTEIEEEHAPEYEWGTVQFALTSEAGLNDGLAFPFTNLAIAVAAAALSAEEAWLLDWVLVDVLYKISAGVVVGYLIGEIMARTVFRAPGTLRLAEVTAGAEALAATFLAYGLTELAGGYGFVAVFVAALALRHFEWEHDYYRRLHDFAVMVERLLLATVLVLFGGALAGGLLAPLTLPLALLGLALLLVIRPFVGAVAFVGSDAPLTDRAVVSFFGIRGIGSFYYLSYALAHASFRQRELVAAAEQLWAFVGFVVLVSVVLHGVSASPIMNELDRRRERATEAGADTER